MKRRSLLHSGYKQGFFFGMVEGTEEVWIGTEESITKACSSWRMPEDMRADADNFN
jgi:hypothetical protein